jgi:hypothetical protein
VGKLQDIQLASASTPLASERVLHFASRRLSQSRYDAPVGVEGDSYGGVPEHLGDDLRVDAFRQ